MKTLKWMLVPLALSVTAPALAAPPAGPPGSAHFGERMQEKRSKALREKVGLTEDKAKRVEAILKKYAPERKKAHEEMRAAHEKLEALIDGKSNDQAQYRAALDSIRSRRKATQDVMERAFNEVAKELTPEEQAKLFVSLGEMRGHGKHGRGPGKHGRGHGFGRGHEGGPPPHGQGKH